MGSTREAAPTRTLTRLGRIAVGLLAGTGAVVVALPAPAAVAGSVTSTVSAATVNLGVGGTVTDTVTVQGTATYGSPTGSVTFYVCQTGTTQTVTTGACSPVIANHFGSKLLTGAANDSSTATSAVFTPTSGGTWCFSAVYGGDANYASDSDNTDGTNLDANECVLVTTDPSTSYSVISAVQVALGPSGTVTDTVTVQGTVAGGPPTGTVDFFACLTNATQTYTPGPCPNAGTPVDSESLLAGVGDTSSAQSAVFTPNAAGTWCFSTVYGGDVNYNASSDNTYNGNLDANECVLVTTVPAGSTSQISSASITLGPSGMVTDLVTVSGNAAGGSPTGQVTYFVCQIASTQTLTTGPCPAVGNGQATETLSAAANDTATTTSPSFTPTAAGTWCFSAVYGGDSNYSGTSDNTGNSNLDPNECVLVGQASTTTSTHASGNVTFGSGTATDSVTITGNSVGGSPSGTVTIYVCQTGSTGTQTNGACPATGTPQGTPTLSAQPNDQATTVSTAFTPTSPGTWCFSAVYGGDANYQGSSDNTTNGNLDANECFFVNAIGPVVTTQPTSQTVPLGNLASFTAAASGAPTPTVQWQVSTDGGATYTDVGGANSTSFSVAMTLANSGYWYRAVFTNFGGSATTNGAGAAVAGGTNVPSATTLLFGNKVIKVHGAGWNVHGDSSVTISECASSVYSALLCHTPPSSAVVSTSGLSIGKFPGTALTIVAGTMDTNGDTCGILGSAQCYLIVRGGAGDETSVAVTFSTPTVILRKSTAVLGNFDNLVHAKHFPAGDPVFAEQCDNTANTLNLGTHCDAATEQSAVTGATGTVPFPAGITMRVASTYSDTAGGVCVGGTTCHIEVIDSANPKFDFLVTVAMAAQTVVITPTSQVTGSLVKVTAKGFPIGDSAVTSQCDTAATTTNIATNCDPSNSLTGTVGTGGTVVWPIGSFGKIPVLSTHGSPLYSDSSNPPAGCAPGDTVGNLDPCFVEVHDPANAGVVVLAPLSITS